LIGDEFVKRMRNFEVMGAKKGPFTKYQTINYIETAIEGIEQAKVDEFSFTFGRLFRWLKDAVENRKTDIIWRKANSHKDREERDFKIKAMEDRAAKRSAELNDA
jgi:hypothetical protein